MPSNQTQNYKLSQWEPGDAVLRTDFNADNEKTDAAIKEVDVRVDGLAQSKADRSELTALSQRVDSKADSSALTAKGNCRIYTTYYTGTGKHGATNPCTLNLPYKPTILIVAAREKGTVLVAFYGQSAVYAHDASTYYNRFTWNGNTVSWFSTSSDTIQQNELNVIYDVAELVVL